MNANQIRIDLGQGERGEQRLAALRQMAQVAGHTHGGNPSIGKLIVALADTHIQESGKVREQWAMDGSAVKIYGQHSPNAIIATVAVVDHFGNTETTFHQIHRMRRENWLPRPNASESRPFCLRDIEMAEENERRQCRYWEWGTHYPSINEFVYGYHHHAEDGFAIFMDGTRVKLMS